MSSKPRLIEERSFIEVPVEVTLEEVDDATFEAFKARFDRIRSGSAGSAHGTTSKAHATI